MNDTVLTLVLTALGTTIASLAGWAWLQIGKGREREDALSRDLAAREVELAVAQTKLAAYGGDSPRLADKVDHLTDLVLDLIGEDPPPRSEDTKQLPWPSRTQRPRRRP